MEKLVQEIVNAAHIHCISESSPCPSLPALPPSSPTLSAPCIPSDTSPIGTNSMLASSASYTDLTSYPDTDDDDGPRHMRSVTSMSESNTPRYGQPYHSYSLMLPTIPELGDDDDVVETNKSKDREVLNETRPDSKKAMSHEDKGKKRRGATALIQTLPHSRELDDIKTKVEVDRLPSPQMNDENYDGEGKHAEITKWNSITVSSRTLSFSASSLPDYDTSTFSDNPTRSAADDQEDKSEAASKHSSGEKRPVIPTLPIRVRRSSLACSDQPASALPESSPMASPEQQRKRSLSSLMEGSGHGSPMLILSLRPSVPPLASHMPQLESSTFDWTDMDELKKLVCLFPVTQQRFISNFLFTQHFTVFTERLAAIYGRGNQRSNVLTPRSAARYHTLPNFFSLAHPDHGSLQLSRAA